MRNENSLKMVSLYRTPIMGFATLLIWFFHNWYEILQGIPVLAFTEQYLRTITFVGVDFFLFLSGIGLIFAIEKYPAIVFYKRRISRIILPFLIMGIVHMIYCNWSFQTLIENLSGYAFYTKDVLAYKWYVHAIILLYLLFPLFYFFFKKSSSQSQFIYTTMIIWFFLSIKLQGNLRPDMYTFTNRIPVFLMGVMAGWTIREKDFIFTKTTWVACAVSLFVGLYLACRATLYGVFYLVPCSEAFLPAILIAIPGTCLLAKAFSFIKSLNFKLTDKFISVLSLYGKMSLEFYCVHELLGYALKQYITFPIPNIIMNILDLLMCTLASWLMVKLCERIKKIFSFSRKLSVS